MKKFLLALLLLFAINYGYSQTYIPNNSTTTPSTGYSYNIDGNTVTGGLSAFGTGINNTMRTTIKGIGSTSSTYPLYITNGSNTSTFYSDDAGNVKILGGLGIGGGTANQIAINIVKPLTGGPTANGVALRSVAQSDVVNYLYGFSTQMSTLAPGIGDVYHFYAGDITKNPGAIISFQIGFYAPALNSANSNIGFRTDAAAGPNNYGFFGGSAKNFMGWGATLINQTGDNGVDKLQVNGSVSTAGLDNYTADISNTYTALSKISKGYANTNFLQNQTAIAQAAGFNISGNGVIGGNQYISGNVGIGTTQPDAKLTVVGIVHASQVNVDQSMPPPDYVFDKAYDLATLTDVKSYIDKNHHLPEIPSAAQITKDGINVGEMNMKLLKKIEELTLYLIQKDKADVALQTQVVAQQGQIDTLKKLCSNLMKTSHSK